MAKKSAKQPTQEVPQDILEEVLRIGELMSRRCYDVATNKLVTSQDRIGMDYLCRQWDAATNKLRDFQKGSK